MSASQDTFVEATVALGVVWALKGADEDWAICEFNKGEFDAMLLWSEEKGAKACAVGEWAAYKPTSIDLKSYLESWLPAMKEDGVKININFGPRSRGSVIEPDELVAAYLLAQGKHVGGAS